MSKKNEVAQERVIWDGDDRQVVKVLYKDKSYRVRVDVYGHMPNKGRKVVIQEYLDPQTAKFIEQLITIASSADKYVATFVEGLVEKASEKVAS